MEKLFSSVSLLWRNFSCLRVTCGETFLVCESRVGKGSGVTSEVGSPRRDTGGASQSW